MQLCMQIVLEGVPPTISPVSKINTFFTFIVYKETSFPGYKFKLYQMGYFVKHRLT